MSKPKLTIISDFTDAFNNVINALDDKEVLVGIPEQKGLRKDDDDDGINNAALLFINEFGSPVNNIPPRQPMKTGIKNAQPAIAEQFKKCAIQVLDKGAQAIDVYLERAGIIAANSVKKVINDQENMDPPAESTLAARRARGFAGTKSLVVTGQMRNAITSVVRSKKLWR